MSRLLESRRSNRARRIEVARTGDRQHTSQKRPLAIGAIVVGFVALGLVFKRLRVRLIVVEGPSMLPTLDYGDRVLVVGSRRYRAGDIVVLRDPEDAKRILVKRIAEVSAEGLSVLGDNEGASRDSRNFGTVDPASVLGVVLYRYYPYDQAELIARGSKR